MITFSTMLYFEKSAWYSTCTHNEFLISYNGNS